MNKIHKRGTSDEDNPRYNVGGFKIVPNKIDLINVINTSSPKDTPKDIDNLLSWYNSNDKSFYLRGLKNYEGDKMFLIDTVKHEQDLYETAANEIA